MGLLNQLVIVALFFARSAHGWTAIPKLKTVYEVVTKAPAGAQLVSKGDTVTVHATGTVKETGKKFWSTKDPGQTPFTYAAGVGGVITGWDLGLLGAALGETRKLDIPAAEGAAPASPHSFYFPISRERSDDPYLVRVLESRIKTPHKRHVIKPKILIARR